MSVLDRVKELVATVADGAHHAMLHIAEEVDKLKTGMPAVDLEKLTASLDLSKVSESVAADVGAKLEAKADAFFADLKAEFGARLEDTENVLVGLRNELQAVAAAVATGKAAAEPGDGAKQDPEKAAGQAAPGSAV